MAELYLCAFYGEEETHVMIDDKVYLDEFIKANKDYVCNWVTDEGQDMSIRKGDLFGFYVSTKTKSKRFADVETCKHENIKHTRYINRVDSSYQEFCGDCGLTLEVEKFDEA